MVENQLSLIGDFTDVRPDDVKEAVQKAQKKGVVVAESQQFQATFAHLLNEFKKREGRYSPNTLRRLESAWGCFVQWCLDNKLHSMPASPSTVEQFFIFKAEHVHRNTLNVYKWAISRVHKITGCPDPTKDIFVEDRIKEITRTKVQAGESIKQASPFNEQHLNRLVSKWMQHERVLNRRNIALLAVAYESMLRAQEVANIKLQDIELTGDGTAILTIPITKTNHSGEPDTCILSADVVGLVLDYLEPDERKLTDDGWLFAGVSKHNKSTSNAKPITTKTVEAVFKAAWVELELERQGVKCFTAHSARVGATQDLLKKGFNTLQIQQSGRWTSEVMVARYGRAILAKESAMAQSRTKQRTQGMQWGSGE